MTDDKQTIARDVAETMIGNCGFSQGLGMRIADAGPDFASIEMTLTSLHMNGHDICHGGAIFAMADTAFAHACNSDNIVTVAQQCQVNFLKPGKLGDVLCATAQARSLAGRTGIYDVAVTDQNGALIAEFRGMCRKLSGPVIPAEPDQHGQDAG
jgi:acyl-CoA thioesterase